MPTDRTASTRASAPKGPALAFDPRYVNFVIETWQNHDLAPMRLEELVAATSEHAKDALIRLNEMGLLEEDVVPGEIAKVITIFKTLKLLRQVQTGPRDARVTKVYVTPEGRDILGERPTIGGLRPQFTQLLVSKSPELQTLLCALNEHGPLVQPVLSLMVGAPRKGKPYSEAIEQGLEQFWTHAAQTNGHHSLSENGTSNGAAKAQKLTPKQVLDSAKARAAANHPASKLKQLDKLAPLASVLGLTWTDIEQLNDVIAAQYIGAATLQDATGACVPNTLTWDEIKWTFVPALVRAHAARENGSGFATIDALRGAIGHAIHLSPSVVDSLICAAREAGERHEAPVSLHFEPNEDMLYHRERHPLIWLDHAFDFVEVTASGSFTMPDAERVPVYY